MTFNCGRWDCTNCSKGICQTYPCTNTKGPVSNNYPKEKKGDKDSGNTQKVLL